MIGGHCVDHGVDVPQHDFLRADSHDLRDVQRLLLVKHRVAFIVVERQLVIILDGEHPAGNTGSFVRLDRQVAAGFRAAKHQPHIRQGRVPDDAGVRAAVEHLGKVQIRTISKIVFHFQHPPFEVFSWTDSSFMAQWFLSTYS